MGCIANFIIESSTETEACTNICKGGRVKIMGKYIKFCFFGGVLSNLHGQVVLEFKLVHDVCMKKMKHRVWELLLDF